MNGKIKNIVLLLVFIVGTALAVSALNQEGVDGTIDSVSDLSLVESELAKQKSTRSISRLIRSALKELTDAISNPGTSCTSRLENILSKLEQAASQLSSRSCTQSRRKGCIEDGTLTPLLNNFNSAISSLREALGLDSDGDGTPDVCEEDPDGDGLSGMADNCPLVNNPIQKDTDGNGIGDSCDLFLCCLDSSLTVQPEGCDRRTITSCREQGGVVIGGLGPLTGGRSMSMGGKDEITFSPVAFLGQTASSVINFGSHTTIRINTGFIPFNNSQGVLDTFSQSGCTDLNLTFTPPTGFPGGTFEVGPAGNGFETGPRQIVQIVGDMVIVIPIDVFPINNPTTQNPFNPQAGDQLGFSLFTSQENSPPFASSFFDVFVEIDLANPNCKSPLGSSSGGSSSGGNTSSGGTSSGDFGTMLQDDVNMLMIHDMAYMDDYDCDDFAEDLGMSLQMQGYNTTFTAIWMNNGMDGHAVTDIHTNTSGIIFIEPQNGMIIDLDENMDGMVGYRDGMHSESIMPTEGMTEIEVYMDRDSAAMAGVPVD